MSTVEPALHSLGDVSGVGASEWVATPVDWMAGGSERGAFSGDASPLVPAQVGGEGASLSGALPGVLAQAAARFQDESLRTPGSLQGAEEQLRQLRQQVEQQRVQLQQERAQLHERFERSFQTLSELSQTLGESMMREFCELSVVIGSELALKSFQADPQALAQVVNAALSHSDPKQHIVVKVPLQHAEQMRAHVVKSASSKFLSIEVLGDDALSEGSCAIESEVNWIDATFEKRLANIRAALGLEALSAESVRKLLAAPAPSGPASAVNSALSVSSGAATPSAAASATEYPAERAVRRGRPKLADKQSETSSESPLSDPPVRKRRSKSEEPA